MVILWPPVSLSYKARGGEQMVMDKHRHLLSLGKGSLWLCVVCGVLCDGAGVWVGEMGAKTS